MSHRSLWIVLFLVAAVCVLFVTGVFALIGAWLATVVEWCAGTAPFVTAVAASLAVWSYFSRPIVLPHVVLKYDEDNSTFTLTIDLWNRGFALATATKLVLRVEPPEFCKRFTCTEGRNSGGLRDDQMIAGTIGSVHREGNRRWVAYNSRPRSKVPHESTEIHVDDDHPRYYTAIIPEHWLGQLRWPIRFDWCITTKEKYHSRRAFYLEREHFCRAKADRNGHFVVAGFRPEPEWPQSGQSVWPLDTRLWYCLNWVVRFRLVRSVCRALGRYCTRSVFDSAWREACKWKSKRFQSLRGNLEKALSRWRVWL